MRKIIKFDLNFLTNGWMKIFTFYIEMIYISRLFFPLNKKMFAWKKSDRQTDRQTDGQGKTKRANLAKTANSEFI